MLVKFDDYGELTKAIESLQKENDALRFELDNKGNATLDSYMKKYMKNQYTIQEFLNYVCKQWAALLEHDAEVEAEKVRKLGQNILKE